MGRIASPGAAPRWTKDMLNTLQDRADIAASARKLQDCRHCPIRGESVCSVLNWCELVAFQKIGQRVSLRPRSSVFTEGERADAVFNITSGFVRLYRLSANGRRQVVGFAFPGDFLGLYALKHHNASADAVVATTLCRFARPPFLAFVHNHPHLMQRLHDAAILALGRAQDQMLLLGPGRAEAKIGAFLLMMKKRWEPLRGDTGTIALPMQRQDIGDFLGLSIATVSRTLRRLCRQEIIRIVGRTVQVLDTERLERKAWG